jgi:hypothetical protein
MCGPTMMYNIGEKSINFSSRGKVCVCVFFIDLVIIFGTTLPINFSIMISNPRRFEILALPLYYLTFLYRLYSMNLQVGNEITFEAPNN